MDEARLYVWAQTFCDQCCGVAFSVAPDKETAIQQIAVGEPGFVEKELRKYEPEVYEINSHYGFVFLG